MSISHLYASVTGCSGIESVNVTDSHGAATSTATIICTGCSLDIGDAVSVNLGYSDDHDRLFSGYVKNIQMSQQPTHYEISCANKMIRAVDYFLVSSSPLTPFKRSNIAIQNLIRDLMQQAGLTSFSLGSPGFTIATKGTPLEINLVSVYDYCKMLADLVAWAIWADDDGVIHFDSRPPFPGGGYSSSATLDGSNSVNLSFYRSDRDLRNRVVVYGSEDVHAEASASSPYLPSGFYKSVVVAAPGIITTNATAQASANYNLAKLNRLTIGGSGTVIGDPSIVCRSCVTVNRSDIGMSGLFYVYGCEHDWGKDGYTTNVDLRQ